MDFLFTFVVILLVMGGLLDVFWLLPDLQTRVDRGEMEVGSAILTFILFPFIWYALVVVFIALWALNRKVN